ncbi:MAG TPA: CHAD domain-containing protein [Acidimicrobiales bacterium]|nr:CHAD domain-containing protein [Acidimicrobiales bacterium]
MPAAGPTPQDMEVEWQFDALDLRPVERWLNADVSTHDTTAEFAAPGGIPGSMVVEALPSRRLVDTYLDTTDWRIGRSGFVLRLRRRAGAAELTLKDTSPAKGGLRQRLEVTEPLADGNVDALGADGPVGRRLHALIGNRPLRQVLGVRTRRRPYALRLDGSQAAELALDDTVIEVVDSAQPVRLRRVEVEIEGSSVERLSPLVERLRRECGLQPATLSKFEAGLLASGVRIPAGPDLGPVTLPALPSVGELAFVVLRRNLRAMLAHEAGTRLGEDPEELHDMRVATRRMRAALAMFADVLPVRARQVRSELGWVADALGSVRDLDVQLERVEQWAADMAEPDKGALADLAHLLTAQRAEARDRLLAVLESGRYERLVSSFAALLRQGPSRRVGPARAPALVVVPDLVGIRHRAVTKAVKRARRSGAPDDFHRLRIRGKRLRYALEFVSELYSSQTTTKYVRALVRLQDILGAMQDARVAAERLHALVLDEESKLSTLTVFLMGGVAQRYRQEAIDLRDRLPKRLDALTGSLWHQMIGSMDRRRLAATPTYGWATAPLPPAASPPAQPRSAGPTRAPNPDATARPSRATSGSSTTNGHIPNEPIPPEGGTSPPR